MFQDLVEAINFEEFVEWKPENGRYELYKISSQYLCTLYIICTLWAVFQLSTLDYF